MSFKLLPILFPLSSKTICNCFLPMGVWGRQKRESKRKPIQRKSKRGKLARYMCSMKGINCNDSSSSSLRIYFRVYFWKMMNLDGRY